MEDDEDDRLLFCDILLREVPGLQIIGFTNAGQLLALINGNRPWKEPDLILIDVNMPALNCLDLLRAVRQHERINKVPVVMMSTASNDELVAQVYELGVNAFIAKPVSTTDYAIMASAISICFLNGFWRTSPLPANGIRKDARVIIVEDSDEHWNLIKLSFQSNGPGLQLIRLRDKAAVFEYFSDCFQFSHPSPAIVVLDLYLPSRQDGLDALDNIRYVIQSCNLPRVPIVIFSYSDDRDDIRSGYLHQTNAYLVKPPNVAEWPPFFKTCPIFGQRRSGFRRGHCTEIPCYQ